MIQISLFVTYESPFESQPIQPQLTTLSVDVSLGTSKNFLSASANYTTVSVDDGGVQCNDLFLKLFYVYSQKLCRVPVAQLNANCEYA